MASRLLTAFLLLGFAFTIAESSDSESSDDDVDKYSDLTQSPSLASYGQYPSYNSFSRNSPFTVNESADHFLSNYNNPNQVYDRSIYDLLGMDNNPNSRSRGTSQADSGLTALETALKPGNGTIESTSIDQTFVAKSAASLLLAIIFLLFYNGLFRHIFQ